MPRPKTEIRQEAIRLRLEERRGGNEIAKMLGVSKGSASRWLRDYPLRPEEVRLLQGRGDKTGAKKPRPTKSNFAEAVANRRLSNIDKGKIAEAAVMFRLVLHGINVFGSVFDGDKADWLVGIPETRQTWRIQVRWARWEKVGNPVVSLRCGEGRGTLRTIQEGEFDFIVGYDLYSDTAYVWSWEDVAHLTSTVTVAPESAERWDKLRNRGAARSAHSPVTGEVASSNLVGSAT